MRSFQHLRVANQYAQLRAAPGARQQRRGGRQTERAGTGDHQHRNRRVERTRHIVRYNQPPDKGQERNHQNRWHENRRNTVGKARDGCLRFLSGGNQLAHFRERRLRPHAGGAHRQRPGGVQGCAGDRIAHRNLDGHRFAGQQGGIHGGRPCNNRAVSGDFFTRAHQEFVSRQQVLDRNLHLARGSPLVGAKQGRGACSQAQQGAQSLGRAGSCTVLNCPTDQQE